MSCRGFFGGLKLEWQCVFLSVITIIISLGLNILSILYLDIHNQNYLRTTLKQVQANMDMTEVSLKFVSGITLVVSLLWMFSAVLLIIGVSKNKSGCVVLYFVYGIFITIAANIGAILLALHNNWIIALCILIVSLGYVRCLATVYKVYNLMQRGKVFGDNEHNLLEEETN